MACFPSGLGWADVGDDSAGISRREAHPSASIPPPPEPMDACPPGPARGCRQKRAEWMSSQLIDV